MLDRYIGERDATRGSLKTKELGATKPRVFVRFQAEVFGSEQLRRRTDRTVEAESTWIDEFMLVVHHDVFMQGHPCTVWTYLAKLAFAIPIGMLFSLLLLAMPPFDRHDRPLGLAAVEAAIVGTLEGLVVTFLFCILE